MNVQDLEAILAGIAPTLKALREDNAALRKLLEGIPQSPGPTLEIATIQAMIDDSIAQALNDTPKPSDGPQGKQGDPGADGTSVTLADVQPWIAEEIGRQLSALMQERAVAPEVFKELEERYERDLAAWTQDMSVNSTKIAEVIARFDALPVPQDGKDGAPGVDGKDGADGKDGVSVDIAAIKAEVETFLKSLPIPRDGAEGAKGRAGRDAIEIQVHPAIDVERSYPKNSYASHRAGLWRATEQTNGMQGWECLVEGIADVKEADVDDREVEITYELSSGRTLARKRLTSSMIYRGVWREMDYRRGDVVTWAGSSWHCNANTATRPETVEGAKAWTLMTKRGDKGRDAR